MCGIAGIVDFNRGAKRLDLSRMLRQIKHRGPDSSGQYSDGPVAIGIRRLSIIDLKTGDQPIFNEDRSVVVVFNGEIYNYLQLKKKLEKNGHVFSTKSDTEVLVHLYEEEGENLVKSLNGMFAFSLWDSKQKKLVVARDHVGIKPLYYWQRGQKLVFGSEAKTVLSHPLVPKTVNEEAVSLYSWLGYVPQGISMFATIQKLLPGQVATFSKSDGWKTKTYYHVEKPDKNPQTELDQLFTEVLNRQSIADVPVGLLLSGGLDSSLIAYYATKHKHHIKSFSIGFSEKRFDESDYAFEVAKHLKTDHYAETFTAQKLVDVFPRITKLLDEPLADPSLFPTYEVCRLAREQVKVALSGDGGDELFGGYPTYQGHLVAEKLKLPHGVKNMGLHLAKSWPKNIGKFGNYPLAETAIRYLAGSEKDLTLRHLQWMSIFQLGQQPLRDISDSWTWKKLKSITPHAQIIDIKTYLVDDLLVKTDRASMFNSLEVRVPFLDREVIAYALARSDHADLFTTKKLLRQLLKDKLPAEVLNRPKKGFGIPISEWIRHPLRDLVQSYLSNQTLDNFFDRKEVDMLWKDHLSQRTDNSKIVWMLLMFSAWLKEWTV